MHALHEYLCEQLEDKLKKRRVVVFYDPRQEFLPLFDRELEVELGAEGELPRVTIGQTTASLARFEGSYFGLRAAVEPIASQDKPEPLLLYLPGEKRDSRGSVLMELEQAGTCYEPPLKRLALNVLRKRFTDGVIDGMLQPAKVGYDDIVSFLHQGDEGQTASVLRSIYANAQPETLLARWIADDSNDAVIAEKEAASELFALFKSRLGLELGEGTDFTDARRKALRYVLINEFRSDLDCDPPPSVSMVPSPPNGDELGRVGSVAETLRQEHGDRYPALADQVEADLQLQSAHLDAAYLGRIDTFRFEERALLSYAGALVVAKDYPKAVGIAAGRRRSFWVDREVGRQAQWEACRLMAELGREIERIKPALAKAGKDPAKWVQAYVSEDGWYRADELQRRLETWVATMDDEPETEQALAIVRREHEELLKRMADGFAKVFGEAGWSVQGALHQTSIYPDVVEPLGGRVAYFFVDAMRYEMGVELARQLTVAKDLTIRPAIAALPTITPVGMAALLPGASASFSVVEHKGKLAARIDSSAMPGLADRLKFLKARIPDAVELTLGKLLSTPPSRLSKALGSASLVVIRSQEIDFVGEMDGEMLARQVMDTIIGNLARAVRKLAAAGVESFVITADHGHQFSIRKDEDMKTDAPGGDTLDIHRRCWIGRGGTTPAGTVRVGGADLGYDTDLEFVFPTGLGVFKAGGGLSFHHGSVSLQELVVPVLSLRVPAQTSPTHAEKAAELRGVPTQLTNRTFGVRLLIAPELFANEAVALRVILVSGGEQVGESGMAVGAQFDHTQGILQVTPGVEATVGLMLKRDDCTSVRVVVQDPASDAVLAQSEEIPVKLGI